MVDSERSDLMVGLLASTIGHVILAAVFLLNLGFGTNKFLQPVIYSISIEGGKSLGGMSQVPKDDKAKMAPPKKVQAMQEKSAKKEEQAKVPDKKVEKEEKKIQEKKEEEKRQKEKENKLKKESESQAEINKQLQQAMQRYRGESTDAGGQGFGAGKLGGKGMGGGTILPAEALQYRETLKNAVKQGWTWYDTNAPLTAWVDFEIAKDGTVSNVALYQSSGNREYDNSVLRAIWKASPVPPPPEKVYEYFMKVRMSFDPRE